MRNLSALGLIFAAGMLAGLSLRHQPASAAPGLAAAANGDINADGAIDVSDAVSLLNFLFLAGPEPAKLQCPAPLEGTPATGLKACYDEAAAAGDCAGPSCPGQDGFYQRGCAEAGRFTDNGDGTVTDGCTGLIWQRESTEEKYGWCEALRFCEDLELGGSTEWRLPNVRELSSILNYGAIDLAIDPVFVAQPGGHWSSTTQVTYPESAWCVIFSYGSSEWVVKSTTLNVRAVRSGR